MSQKKVDEYKERKVNREKIYKKEKRILMMEKLVGLAICLVAVVWIGYSVYGQYQRNLQENPGTCGDPGTSGCISGDMDCGNSF